jgi:hypothetical protein
LPKQSDIDKCVAAAGASKVAGCLEKNGIKPDSLSQANIDQCLSSAGGQAGVEKCLLKNAVFPGRLFISQHEFHVCSKTDSLATSAKCLENSGLLPAGATQATIDSCVTAVGENAVVKCFRNTGILSRALMAAHATRCVEEVGAPNLITCLEDNGLFLNGLDKAVAQNCVTSGGVANLTKCLRTQGQLSPVPTQAEVQFCHDVAGAENIDTCEIILYKVSESFPFVMTQRI